MPYRAPVGDLEFALTAVAGGEALMGEGGFADFDAEILRAVLEAGAEFAEGVLEPLDREGDRVGSRLENGEVRTPPGFPAAFKAYGEGGWNGLTGDPAFGGQGLPRALMMTVFEMVNAANMSFALAPTLTVGAIDALESHGSEAQKALYLPRLLSGEWSGTMNLTEAHAGSDLGLIRTRAEPDGEGGYRLTGEKIFITWGDHDCAENILHLVLARLPGAPEGVKGISLFLAPKRRVEPGGTIGAANALRVGGLEHKLGIHASPTCTMLFEGAAAELVGRPHEGLSHMFTMMNAARLNVGVQGVGVAEKAWQRAVDFARERRQGRSPWSDSAPAPIIAHPDIRRRLLLAKAKIEAARGICLTAGVAADLARSSGDPDLARAARLREEFLTPIAKAWSTEIGVEVASEALQVHGGMGYIEETGAAQSYRDARIAPIYEGTNAIQALDLAGRKLPMESGEALGRLASDMRGDLAAATEDGLADVVARLRKSLKAMETASEYLLERRGRADLLAAASPYLTLAGETIGGWMLLRGALKGGAGRVRLARLYAAHVLSGAEGRLAAVAAGADDLADPLD